MQTTSRTGGGLFLALLAAWALPACDSEPEGPGALSPSDKIDPPVAAELETRSRVPVLLLGRTQLLEFPDGFRVFTASNAGRDRLELRGEVISQLKEIAAGEGPVIRSALGLPDDPSPLWLVNAIVASLSAEEIEAAAELEEVRYIYYAGTIGAPPGDPGGVGLVIPPTDREPFQIGGRAVPWNLRDVGADRVWTDLGVSGAGSVVAVLDVGVDYTHQDLQGNIWINEDEVANNGVDDDGNGYVDDYYGFNFRDMRAEVGASVSGSSHGTWVSGIIVGDGSGGTITGIAPRARVMPLLQNSVFTAILAHQYALENGADVINMSFSLPYLGNLRGVWRLMAEQAAAAGLVLVSGAGNFRQTESVPEQLRIPEGIPSVIAVGGVNRDLSLAKFSSMGPVEWISVRFYGDHPSLTKPDVVGFPGPGYPVLHPSGTGYVDPNPTIRGNSFSGPHAAGVAALILSAEPGLTAWRVKEILEETAGDLPPSGKDNATGAGLIDAYAAVSSALGG